MLEKIFPLYFFILIGFWLGKKYRPSIKKPSAFVFFLLSPLVIFTSVLNVELSLSALYLPVISYTLSLMVAICAFYSTKDESRPILAICSSIGNTGYFGLPVALHFLDPATINYYILALLGVTLFENSLGYYVGSLGRYSASKAIQRVLRLPSLYAFIIATLLNLYGFKEPSIISKLSPYILNIYSICGMTILGLSLTINPSKNFDKKFITLSFFSKFILWPGFMLSFIQLDLCYLGLYSSQIHNALFLLSIVPTAINSVIIASLCDCFPEKASQSTLLSTCFALFYVPLMMTLFLTR